MKNYTKSILLGVALLGSAFVNASQLNLKMFDNGMFSTCLDGNYTGQPSNTMSMDLAPGEHFLKVAKCVAGPWGMMQMQQVFSGCITIPMQSKVFATISCHGCYDVIKVEPICEPHWGNWGGGNCGNNNGWGNGNCGNTGGSWNQGTGEGNYGNYMPCMSPQEFHQLKCVVNSQSFDSGKLGIIKQAVSMNYVSSAQVSELMSEMTFDSYKLSVAEVCYPRTIDKQNYYLVNSNFVFSSSVSELNSYIAHI